MPETIRVKLSSEAAGAVSFTPVVSQELAMLDLLEVIVSTAGPDVARVAEVLKRGNVVSGSTRYRWPGLECDHTDLHKLLSRLPVPEPERPFNPQLCTRVILRSGLKRYELTVEVAAGKGWFQKSSFWESVCALGLRPLYVTYLYREKADSYRSVLSAEQAAQLSSAANAIRNRALALQIANTRLDSIEFLQSR